MKRIDIHNINTRLNCFLKRVDKLPERNRDMLLKFKAECYSQGLSNARVLFYISRITRIAEIYKKNFDEMDKDDLKKIVSDIEGNPNYKEWTKSGYKIALKKFFQFVSGLEWSSRDFPQMVKWIHSKARESKLEDPTILTKEEILKMFEAAEGIREKALVSFMYEGMPRCPDELFHMKCSDVVFDEYGAQVKLSSGKVGSRTIRVVSCVPYLKRWISEEHPNSQQDNYVWVGKGNRNHGKLISYNYLEKMVRKWTKKAGITKRVTPYTFRRTRYTHLAPKLPTPILYKYAGQVQGSSVIRRYLGLSTEDTDESILSFYGMKNLKTNGDIKPLFCSICGKQAPPEKQFCPTCNAPLTEKAKLHVEEKKTSDLKGLVEEMIKEGMQAEIEKAAKIIARNRFESMEGKK